MKTPFRERRRLSRFITGSVLALMVIGFVLRVTGAWWLRNSQNPDYGQVLVMARHMAEGRDFPMFFYGQHYMGSLEPAVSALICWLAGFSPFAVCLGTALIACLLLPVVYAWGRDTGGRLAGAVALAFCVCGPGGYFHYMASPRGGYAVTLLLAAWVLRAGARLAHSESNGRANVWHYAAIGFAAGLGWWSNPLILAVLGGVALMLLLSLGRKLFCTRMLAAPALFVVGSLPFWWWNLRNEWGTFAFAESMSLSRLRTNLPALIGDRFPWLFGMHDTPTGLSVIQWIVYAAAFIVSLAILFKALWRQRPLSRRALNHLAIWLSLGCYAVLFGLSEYGALPTPRYLLLWVPMVAALLGAAMTRVAARMHIGVVPVVLAVLAVPHVWSAAGFARNAQALEVRAGEIQAWVAGELPRNDVRGVYAGYERCGYSVVENGRTVFANAIDERCPLHAAFMEQLDSPAVYRGYGMISRFLQMTAGTAVELSESGLYTGLRPLPMLWTPLKPVVVMQDERLDLIESLSDVDLSTQWTLCDGPERVQVRLPSPFGPGTLRLRLLCDSPLDIGRLQVEARGVGATNWSPFPDADGPVTGWFWSGPRPYYGGHDYRIEQVLQCPMVIDRIRIGLTATGIVGRVALAEVQLFSGVPGEIPARESLKRVLKEMERHPIQQLYCDRWAANVIRAETGERWNVPYEPKADRELHADFTRVVNGLPGEAFLVESPEQQALAGVLSSAGLEFSVTEIQPWVLVEITGGRRRHPLVWKYGGCYRTGDEGE